MSSRRRVAVIALGAVTALALAACGGGGTGSGEGTGGADAAINKVANASDVTGGTIRYANSGDWDSLDPADTYYAYAWNFARLYGRSLVMFKSAPGKDGATLVPDLAESLGTSSNGNKTWTYTLRQGVKFEDGTAVTSKDVKYAVERSLDKTTFPNGPTYFNDFLDLQGYTSPYKDTSPDKLGLKAIQTPDDRTIVFNLKKPFTGFDYFAQLPATMPVPQAKDTGTKYKEHVVATGPYMFADNQAGKSFAMVRNPSWDQATDPNRKPLPDRIEVALNVNTEDIDNRLISGDLDVAVEGKGVGGAAQGRILADQTLKANTDNPLTTRDWFSAINADVAPLNNIHCRKAIMYGVDRTGYQRAYGGNTGGQIATNLLPPVIPGAQQFDPYPSAGNTGDLDKAKQELAACGQPNGFTTNISYRAERSQEKATAEALQQSLARIGIQLQVKPYPLNDYLKLYAGKPDYAKANKLGIMVYGWAADWPDGYGFLSQLVDSRVIKPGGGNSNLGVKDPAVDELVDKATNAADKATAEATWVEVDKKVMDGAFLLPGVVAKGLFYRPKNLTNVFITDGFSEYDYLALGTTRK